MFMLKYTTRTDRLGWLVGSVFCIVSSLLPAASTIIIGKLFNEITLFTSGQKSSDAFMSKTLSLCTVLFIFAAIDMVVASINGIIWRLVGFQVGHRTRLSLFKSYCEGDLTWMDSKTDAVGVSSQAFEDVKKLEMSTGIAVAGFVQVITAVLSCYAVAFYFSWAVTLVCMAGFPIIFIVVSFTNPYVEKYAAARKEIENKINSRLHFILDAIGTVKVFRKQKYELLWVEKLSKEIYTYDTKMWQISSMQQSIIRFITLLMFVQGFFFGSYMVRHRGLSAGAVMSTFWACIEGTQAINGLSVILQMLSEGKVSAARLDGIMDQDREMALKNSIGLTKPMSVPETTIKFENVVFSYPSRPELVLRGFSLSLEAGKTHYIIGPSGCGKSSLSTILLKQYPIQAGKVYIGDNLLANMAPSWVHENVTLVEQNAKLFDLPIIDNLKMARRNPENVSEELCEKALRLFKADFIFDLPNGMGTSGSFPFSGGQKQRIQLAKSWISNSPVMIFDESTSAMDPNLEKTMMTAINTFRGGKTTIIITHNLENIPHDHPLYLVEDGEANLFDSVDALRRQRARASQLLENSHRDSILLSRKEYRKSGKYEISALDEKTQFSSDEQSICTVDSQYLTAIGTRSQHFDLAEYFQTISNKSWLGFGILAVVVQAVLTPVFSLVFSKLLMGIFPSQHTETVKWAMLLLLVAAMDGIVTYGVVALQYVASRWCYTTRVHILEKLLKYETIKHEDVAYYKKLLLGDMEISRNIIVRYWHGWVSLISLGLAGLIWAMVAGWKLSLIGLAMVPIIIVTTYYYKRVNHRWNTRLEGQALEVKQLFEDIVTGYRSVKTQNLEKIFEKYYLSRELRLWETAIRLSIFTSISGGILEVFTPVAQGILIYFGFRLISTGEYTPQKTLLVFSMLIFSLVTLDTVAKAIQQCGNAFEALPRIMTTYRDNSQLEVNSYADSVPRDLKWGAISFSRVTVQNTMLNNFSEELEAGQCTVILGPSGCGKTTIATLLLKLRHPSTGTIYIDGHDIMNITNDSVRENICISSQMPIDMFEGTILQNLAYGLDPDIANQYELLATRYCKQCGLHNVIEKTELGYNTILKPGTFSGGQMQRLGIVRALMANPKVLILDEPTSAVDHENSEMIKKIILDCVKDGISVILITHQRDMVKVADRIIQLPR